ncbi:MAG: type II-A CRISPR-associated protein Csn2 [Succinivibrionaceae bacterium]
MKDIRLVRYDISSDIVIPQDKYLTLVIENKEFLYKFISELRGQIDKGEYDVFSFTIDGQAKSLSKYVNAIFDLTNIDLNTKLVMNMITKKLGMYLTDSSQIDNKSMIETGVTNIIEDFKDYSGLNLDYDSEVSEALIVKLANLRISNNDRICLIEKLCDYLDVIIELMPVKLLIVAFLKEFLNEEQILSFNRYCNSKDCNLLIIESSCLTKSYLDEKLYIVDQDLCVIT